MKKLSVWFAVLGMVFFCGAKAADITVYYSPSCPHCHHARDFISTDLIYEYPDIKVNMVNVTDKSNHDKFRAAIAKCEYETGGVPVLVIGEKCFQGYGDFMRDDFRRAVEADLSADAVKKAEEIRKTLAGEGAQAYRNANANRQEAIVESVKKTQKKSNDATNIILYALFGALVVVLGIVLFRKRK